MLELCERLLWGLSENKNSWRRNIATVRGDGQTRSYLGNHTNTSSWEFCDAIGDNVKLFESGPT